MFFVRVFLTKTQMDNEHRNYGNHPDDQNDVFESNVEAFLTVQSSGMNNQCAL